MIKISIPTPCHRQWSELTPASGKGFCSSCQKYVIDFTGSSEQEIVKYISDANRKICGRFREEQLKNDFLSGPGQIRPGISLIKAGVIGVFLMLMSKPILAQEKMRKQKTELVQETQKDARNSSSIEDEEYWVEGMIQDKSDHSGIPGAHILLRGTTHGATTDVDGYFRFPVPLKKGDVLVASFIGYLTEEFKVPAAANKTIVLKLSLDYEIMGEIAVDGFYNPRTTLWLRIKNWF